MPPEKILNDMTEPELRDLMSRLGRAIHDRLPPGTGFLLLATSLGAGGVAQYISNVQRDSAIGLMRETIARWEAGDVVPRVLEFVTTRADGIVGDSQDKRFTYVRDPDDPNVLIEIDWRALRLANRRFGTLLRARP